TEERQGVYCKYDKETYQKIRGVGRDTAWQMILTQTHKYIKYLGYDRPGAYHEELYDLVADPDELADIAGDPAQARVLSSMREYLMYVLDTYQPAQTTWTDSRLIRHEAKEA
ncbi:MAG: hypothetical protein RSC06_16535, partial [Clostridia bacterium]